MSGPVPSPSMKGMMGVLGTWRPASVMVMGAALEVGMGGLRVGRVCALVNGDCMRGFGVVVVGYWIRAVGLVTGRV